MLFQKIKNRCGLTLQQCMQITQRCVTSSVHISRGPPVDPLNTIILIIGAPKDTPDFGEIEGGARLSFRVIQGVV